MECCIALGRIYICRMWQWTNGKASDFQTGIHKIVIQQSGDTDSFEVSVSIGGADKGGPAKLYNDKGEYIGDPILPK